MTQLKTQAHCGIMNGLCDIFTVFIGTSTKPYYIVSYVKGLSVSLKNLTLKLRPFICSDLNQEKGHEAL